MYTLFIDTHDITITMALYKDNELYQKKVVTEVMHSTVCMPTLIDLLKDANLTIDDISLILIVNGPGSFTGTRLGVTIAKTISYCKNIPIKTLTSLEICLPTTKEYIGIEEKNGFYLGKVVNNEIVDYFYVKKNEFSKYQDKTEIKNEINFSKIIELAKTKEEKNPHEVNPIYIKKIEVEND